MKNKLKNIFKILIVVAGCLMFASFSPSLDGRAVVVENGEFPQGLFAKTVGYLPGDIITVTNIAGDKTVDLLVIGALDPSEGVAIMLSPEAAKEMGIDKSSNNIVKITKRSGQDERVYGNAVISKSSASSDDFDDGTFDSIGAVEDSEAFEEPEETETTLVAPEMEAAEEPEESEEPAEVEPEALEETEELEEEAFEETPEEAEEETAEEEAEDSEEEEAYEEEAFAEEPEEETLEEPEEDLSETFEEDEVPEMPEAPEAEEFEAEEPEPAIEETEEAEVAEEPEEENFDEEYADDQEFEEYPEAPAEETFEEDQPAALEEEPESEAFEEDAPEALANETPSEEAFEEDALDDLPSETEEYEAIVLVPAESNPPETAEEDMPAEMAIADEGEAVEAVVDEVEEVEEVGLVEEESAIVLEPVAEVKPSKPAKSNGSYEKYMVPNLKSLESGKYYIQIAVYSSDENINKIIDTYGTNYPITIVPMAGGVSKQVLIGPLTMDEYKVVLERFKSYGFKDAFLRKVR